MHYLKLYGEVIAFKGEAMYNVARFAMLYPANVLQVGGDRFRVMALDMRATEIVKISEREYTTQIAPCRDAASLFKVCQLLKKGRNDGA